MLGMDKELFVQISGESDRRILHPAKVVGVTDGVFTAEPEETDLELCDGQEVLVYYNVRRDFVKQAARVSGELQTEPRVMFSFETLGDTISADGRECYRVSTVISDLTAELGTETECKLLDISTTGFAVESTQSFNVAGIVDAAISHDGERFAGPVCIQSVRELRRGGIRYGVSCAEDRSSQSNLLEGVRRVSTAVQREQLQRLAATG